MHNMMSSFKKAEVIFVDDVTFKWAVMIDGTFFLAVDLMEVGAILIQYPENKEHGQFINDSSR